HDPLRPTLFPYTTLFRSRHVVPFHVEHMGKAASLARNVTDEPLRLLVGRTAEIIEMIGGTGDARRARAIPVRLEELIDAVAAFRSEEHTSELQSRENLVC